MGHIDRAHRYAPWEKVPTGRPYMPSYKASSNAYVYIADQLYACPLIVQRAMSFDQISTHVKVAVADKAIRVGLYEDGVNCYPGALVEDFGEISVAATGIVDLAISPARSVNPGLYWIASISNDVPQIYMASVVPLVLGLNPANFTMFTCGWRLARAYGALPDPFTAGGVVQGQSIPQLYLQPSSLD